jgi:hypothetical protein
MAFHKHGFFSFQVMVQRMAVIGGDRFVADITALRLHGQTGAAQSLEVPVIEEQYGETAHEAEGRAVKAMGDWLDLHEAPPALGPDALGRAMPIEHARRTSQHKGHDTDDRPIRWY